jgi:outer membrane receptor protein involved in Fe transport
MSNPHDGNLYKNKRIARLLFFIFTVIVLFSVFPVGEASAGARGKLQGRLLDKNDEPLIGANVLLLETMIGAAADHNGYYFILNIPPGTYDVRVSSIGYQTTLVRDVVISANQTTTLNVTLDDDIIEIDEIVVLAERPLVDVRQTSAVSILSREDINMLPVQELNDIVNLQAGVIDGHFRGGRLGEVQFQVDGVTINNPFDNSASLRLDRSILEEVQVISGTFDAEFGQAMSGVVNAVLRTGSEERLDYGFESYIGEFVSPGDTHLFPYIDRVRPNTIQNHQFNLSGPLPLPRTTFMLNLRYYQNQGYFYGERRFAPTDSSDFEQGIYTGTGDGAIVPMAPFEEWSLMSKVTNRLIRNMQVSYQAIVNSVEQKRYNHAFRLNPDGMRTQNRYSIVHGIDFTHTLSNRVYYNFSLRQNYFEYRDYVFEDVYDPRYLDAGAPKSDRNYELGAFVQGLDLGRFMQKTDSYILKSAVTAQVTNYHLIKLGGEFQTSKIRFGQPGVLVTTTLDGVEILLPRVNHPDYPGVETYYPFSVAAFIQDRIEWHDLLIRAGLRFEYFDANTKVPSDLQNPANSIEGAPESHPIPTTTKAAWAPRIGVSYPVTDRASIFFSYGHFYQMPGLGDLYSNSDYSVLEELQAGGITYGVLGNPDLKPEFTTQYEFGFKSEITPFLGLDVSLFYKDIRDLLGVEFVSTYTAAEYARLTNIDFGNVIGSTISFVYRGFDFVNATLDYTFQMAEGNSSNPRETATRAAAGEDPRPRLVPLNWDQRHTLNATISLFKPKNYSLTTIIQFGNGMPYTPTVGSGFGAELETNSGRKPSFVLVDLRGEKHISIAGLSFNLFARVFNLFNERTVNGFIFADTGSPFFSLDPMGNAALLTDPSRFHQPRRIELGISFNNFIRM